MTKKYRVTGIGNAILDITSQVSENFLQENNIEKRIMKLVNDNESKMLYSLLSKKIISVGGSIANTMIALSKLGINTSYIGKINDDEMGNDFISDMKSNNVNFYPNFTNNNSETGRCICFITPDGERSMCTNLGASKYIDKNDINVEILKKTEILYLEGYVLDNKKSLEVFHEAIKIVKKNNGKVALTLSDPYCVDRNRELFKSLIDKNIDFLFCNEDELKIFTGSNDINTALTNSPKSIENVICTLGEKGSVFLRNEKKSFITTTPISPIDTTGAGDYFAAGFFFGILCKKSYADSAKIGNKLAGEIIQTIGSRLTGQTWNFLNKELEKMSNENER